MNFLASIFTSIFESVVKILPLIGAYFMGSTKEKKKQAEEALEDVHAANKAKRRAARGKHVKRLRKKYTRREE